MEMLGQFDQAKLEADAGDQQIVTRHPERWHGHQSGGKQGPDTAAQDRQRDRHSRLLGQHRGNIGSDGIENRMGNRNQPAMADHQIEA